MLRLKAPRLAVFEIRGLEPRLENNKIVLEAWGRKLDPTLLALLQSLLGKTRVVATARFVHLGKEVDRIGGLTVTLTEKRFHEVSDETVRRGIYKALRLEVDIDKANNELKYLLKKSRLLRAHVEIEVELPLTEKVAEPKTFEVDIKDREFKVSYDSGDIRHIEALKLELTENDIEVRTIASAWDPSDEASMIEHNYKHYSECDWTEVARQIRDYIEDMLRNKRACPKCGHRVYRFVHKEIRIDDYTVINWMARSPWGWPPPPSLVEETDWFELDENVELYYYCPHCNLVWKLWKETEDARAVANYGIEVYDPLKVGEPCEVLRASKVGVTDDRSISMYYIDILRLALKLGLFKMKTVSITIREGISPRNTRLSKVEQA